MGLKKEKEGNTYPCKNGVCLGSGSCVLESYIENSSAAKELVSTWNLLSYKCPIAGDLERRYKNRLRRLLNNASQ